MTPHHAVSSLSFYTQQRPDPNRRAPHTRPQFDQPTPSNTRGPHSFIYSCMSVEGRQAAR